MEDFWKTFPKDLLTLVFKHIGHRYVKVEIIRWVMKKDIVYMIGTTPFEHFVRERNMTGCILCRKLRPNEKINWYTISRRYPLSEEFINLYHNHLDWYWISSKQRLSERLMNVFSDKLDWWEISLKQKMSEDFKKKYSNRLIRRLIRSNY